MCLDDAEKYRHLLPQLSEAADGLHGLEVTSLHDKLRTYGPDLEGLFEVNFQKATKSMLGIAQKSFHSLDPKIIGQLNTVLQVTFIRFLYLAHRTLLTFSFFFFFFFFAFKVGAKKVDRTYIQKLLSEQLALELSHELGSSYSSLTNISSTFLFERLVERLQILLDKTVSLTKKAVETQTPSAQAAAREAEDQVVCLPLSPAHLFCGMCK